MRKYVSSLFKSWVTVLTGVVVYAITSILVYKGSISFWPEGLIGYCIGTFLVLNPRGIEKVFDKIINYKTGTKE